MFGLCIWYNKVVGNYVNYEASTLRLPVVHIYFFIMPNFLARWLPFKIRRWNSSRHTARWAEDEEVASRKDDYDFNPEGELNDFQMDAPSVHFVEAQSKAEHVDVDWVAVTWLSEQAVDTTSILVQPSAAHWYDISTQNARLTTPCATSLMLQRFEIAISLATSFQHIPLGVIPLIKLQSILISSKILSPSSLP